MMRITSVRDAQMKCYAGIHGKGTEKFLAHTGVKCADTLLGEACLKHKKRSAADIRGAKSQGLVHRYKKASVTHNSALVAECLGKRLAESYSDILYRVVTIHVEIASARELQTKAAVNRKSSQHMVKKAYTGVNLTVSAVKI